METLKKTSAETHELHAEQIQTNAHTHKDKFKAQQQRCGNDKFTKQISSDSRHAQSQTNVSTIADANAT